MTPVPPGFRFHPTEEELVDYYLWKEVASKKIDFDVIKDIDLYKIEPWDLQELCWMGTEEQNEWYFFSHKDKKYPTGTRTNRATKAGFWKATGRDKAIYTKHSLVGMRKTLVFYQGRAPKGKRSEWIMHEYRLETNENGTPQEEGWVACRVFKKKMGARQPLCWFEDQAPFMPDFHPRRRASYHPHKYTLKQELQLQYNMPNDAFAQLPDLESPKVSLSCISHTAPCGLEEEREGMRHRSAGNNEAWDQVTDWRGLDKFVASQLSHNPYDGSGQASESAERRHMLAAEQALITASTPHVVDLWN